MLPLALALAAVALHAPLISWGLPHATGPDRVKTFATDELLPLEGLAEMRSTFVSPARIGTWPIRGWALLTMVSSMMVYHGRTGNLDVPAFFWSAAGLAVFASIFARGLTARRAFGWVCSPRAPARPRT